MSQSSRVDHVKAVEELHEALTAQLSEMTTSEDWLKYLSNARRFHRYSPQNQMLLALQGAEGAVAGYRNWQRIPAQGGGTCQVAKGQVGLMILAPMKGRSVQTDDVTGEEVTKHFLRGFRTVKVFHQGQLVAPPDIGQEAVTPTLLTGENRWQHVWSAVADQLEANGYDVKLHSRSPIEKWNGQTNYLTRQVLIADDLEPAQQLKTLLHEWAHVNLDHETRNELPRDVREVEAESVAYLLGQTIGLDSQAYSVPYIAGWASGDLDLVRTTAQQVLATTKQLVEALERDLGLKLTVDVLDHALPEADTNIIALPGSTPPNPPIPDYVALDASSIAQAALFASDSEVTSPLDRYDSTDAEFLRALGSELEPDQAANLVAVIYRPEHAAASARILAESGRSATQTARILERFGIDHKRIADALATPIANDALGETGPLYHPDNVDVAMATIAAGSVDIPVDILRGERIQDMRMLQRVLRTSRDATLVTELARSFEITPVEVVRVCEASNADPGLAVAVAVGMNDGDGRAAMAALRRGWPEIRGGWESHVHPSMLGPPATTPALVPEISEVDPILEMFDEWDSLEAAATRPSPELRLP